MSQAKKMFLQLYSWELDSLGDKLSVKVIFCRKQNKKICWKMIEMKLKFYLWLGICIIFAIFFKIFKLKNFTAVKKFYFFLIPETPSEILSQILNENMNFHSMFLCMFGKRCDVINYTKNLGIAKPARSAAFRIWNSI